jgi:hypothetical protein
MAFFGTKFKIVPAQRHSNFKDGAASNGTNGKNNLVADGSDAEEEDEGDAPIEAGEVVVSCVGVGYSNVNKAMA